MLRHILLAAGTLSLIACATETADRGQSSASNLTNAVPLTVIHREGSTFNAPSVSDDAVANVVRSNVDLSGLREARVEDVPNADGSHSLLVQQFVANTHSMKLSRISTDGELNVTRVDANAQRTTAEEVHGTATTTYTCPDPTVQFVSFCPNDDSLEIQITNDVGAAAKAANLKTVILLKTAATHDAWLNYMACPKLEGNFYDGDANTSEIVTNDGEITAAEFNNVNMGQHVTNIWLACEAYNDPMLTAVQKTAKSQKYAAGINDLEVGPSDKAAACAMKAAIAGKPMTQAFQDCYHQLNTTSDNWGFGGDGSDMFGQTSASPTSSGDN
jgi:hypothetical protein